jgi:hypothetical protein
LGNWTTFRTNLPKKLPKEKEHTMRTFAMSWEGKPAYRWVKMFRGQRHRVSCAELGLPEAKWTKEDSYQFANEWWNKQIESAVELRKKQEPDKTAELNRLASRIKLAESIGLNDEAKQLKSEFETAFRRSEIDDIPLSSEATRVLDALSVIPIDQLPKQVIEQLFGDEKVWAERKRATKAVEPDYRLENAADEFVKLKLSEVASLIRSAGDAGRTRIIMDKVKEQFGNGFDVRNLDGNSVQKFYLWVISPEKGFSNYYRRDLLATFKSFVRWLWSTEKIEQLPRNLLTLRVSLGNVAKQRFTLAEVKKLLDNATAQLPLHLLLMMNCGFTSIDVSELRRDEIKTYKQCFEENLLTSDQFKQLKKLGFKADTVVIAKKREKTKRQENVPLVIHPLWNRTAMLLDEHRQRDDTNDPFRALLTSTGKPWRIEEIDATGKIKKSDSIRTNFRRLSESLSVKKPLKVFRKTSATILDGNKTHQGCVGFFLGHAEQTVAGKHYVVANPVALGAAVQWLETQYKF